MSKRLQLCYQLSHVDSAKVTVKLHVEIKTRDDLKNKINQLKEFLRARTIIFWWAGHVDRIKEGNSAFKILTGKLAGKGPLGRPRRRWEDNVRMDFKEYE